MDGLDTMVAAAKPAADGATEVTITLERELLRTLCRRSRRRLRDIQVACQATLRLDRLRGVLLVSGSEAAVQAVRNKLDSLGGPRKPVSGPVWAELMRTRTLHTTSQVSVAMLQEETGCRVHIERTRREVRLFGPSEGVTAASALIDRFADTCTEEAVIATVDPEALEALAHRCGVTFRLETGTVVALGLRERVDQAVEGLKCLAAGRPLPPSLGCQNAHEEKDKSGSVLTTGYPGPAVDSESEEGSGSEATFGSRGAGRTAHAAHRAAEAPRQPRQRDARDVPRQSQALPRQQAQPLAAQPPQPRAQPSQQLRQQLRQQLQQQLQQQQMMQSGLPQQQEALSMQQQKQQWMQQQMAPREAVQQGAWAAPHGPAMEQRGASAGCGGRMPTACCPCPTCGAGRFCVNCGVQTWTIDWTTGAAYPAQDCGQCGHGGHGGHGGHDPAAKRADPEKALCFGAGDSPAAGGRGGLVPSNMVGFCIPTGVLPAGQGSSSPSGGGAGVVQAYMMPAPILQPCMMPSAMTHSQDQALGA